MTEILTQLRKLFGPVPQICVSIRDCGEETVTPRKTKIEYGAQIGMNGKEFHADTPEELLAQVRGWANSLIREGRL